MAVSPAETTAAIVIEFSGDPVAKGRPRFASIGGRPLAFTPAKTRKYEAGLKFAAQEAMAGRALLTGPLLMEVTASLPIPRSWSQKKQRAALAGEIAPLTRPDLDNYAKIAADALNCVVFLDDSQIVELLASKQYSDMPGLLIRVEQQRTQTLRRTRC